MHKLFLIAFLSSVVSCAFAQVLVKDRVFHSADYNEGYYDVEPSFVLKEEFAIEPVKYINEFAAKAAFDEGKYKLPPEYAGYQIVQFTPMSDGACAVIRGTSEYDTPVTVLCLYDQYKMPSNILNLNELNERPGFIDYWILDTENDQFFFNLVPFDHGVGDAEHADFYMLYCLNLSGGNILWESECLTSTGSFMLTDDYIFAGYGGTGVSDFVTMLSRHTGQIFSCNPTPSLPEAVGMAGDSIYFQDYQGELYRYLVADQGVRVSGSFVRLRMGPSTDAEIFTDPFTHQPAYPLENDVLAYLGEEGDWFKVSYFGQELYISKKYSERYNGESGSPFSMCYNIWNDYYSEQTGSFIKHPIVYHVVDLDGYGQAEVIAVSPDRAAVFTGMSGSPVLVAEHENGNMHIMPSLHCVRTYFGLSIGVEEEDISFLQDDQIAENWHYSSTPHGNVWTDGEVSVEMKYTKTIHGVESECSAEEYEAKRRLIDDADEYDLFDIDI